MRLGAGRLRAAGAWCISCAQYWEPTTALSWYWYWRHYYSTQVLHSFFIKHSQQYRGIGCTAGPLIVANTQNQISGQACCHFPAQRAVWHAIWCGRAAAASVLLGCKLFEAAGCAGVTMTLVSVSSWQQQGTCQHTIVGSVATTAVCAGCILLVKHLQLTY
jgi:hypothetical protein